MSGYIVKQERETEFVLSPFCDAFDGGRHKAISDGYTLKLSLSYVTMFYGIGLKIEEWNFSP